MFDVEVPAKRKGKPPTVVKEDEEYKNVNPEKFKKLATVFQGWPIPIRYDICLKKIL